MYKRGQLVWSLWHAFAGPFRTRVPLAEVPKPFVRRVTNLIDRGAGLPEDRRAGTGVDVTYELDDALELGIGLALQDLGLPQAEIVLFLRSFRAELRRQFRVLPDKVVFGEKQPRVFLILRPIVIKEAVRTQDRPAMMYAPIAYRPPEFVRGRQALGEMLGGMTDRGRIVLEVADLKSTLVHYLAAAPEVHRGRR